MILTMFLIWLINHQLSTVSSTARWMASEAGLRCRRALARGRGVDFLWHGTALKSVVKIPRKSKRNENIEQTHLVGGLEHQFCFPIYWVAIIIPIDELHHFSGRGGPGPPTSHS